MNSITLNHDAETATEMLNLKKEDGIRIRNIITFETLKGYLLSDELYEDNDNAPRVLTTKSGCIERCLDHLYNDSEKALFFMLFLNAHEGVGKLYTLYSHLDEHMTKLKNSKTYSNLEDGLAGELKRLIVKKITIDIKDKFSVLDVALDCMKRNNYSFDLFMDEYSVKHGDLTDNISDALSSMKNNFSQSNDDEDNDED